MARPVDYAGPFAFLREAEADGAERATSSEWLEWLVYDVARDAAASYARHYQGHEDTATEVATIPSLATRKDRVYAARLLRGIAWDNSHSWAFDGIADYCENFDSDDPWGRLGGALEQTVNIDLPGNLVFHAVHEGHDLAEARRMLRGAFLNPDGSGRPPWEEERVRDDALHRRLHRRRMDTMRGRLRAISNYDASHFHGEPF
jgi:hypothetical protein